MQGDPNRSQEILSTNEHYYADVFLVVGFKYIEKSLDDIPLCSCSSYWMSSPVSAPRTGVSTASINNK